MSVQHVFERIFQVRNVDIIIILHGKIITCSYFERTNDEYKKMEI